MYGEGIDIYSDLLECAVNDKLIEKAGAWYSYNGTQIGQGKDKTINFLKANMEITDAIRTQLKNKL